MEKRKFDEVKVLGFLSDTTHLHIFTWVVGIILFVVAAVLPKQSKGRKITHMTARLFYVLILLSGIFLFIAHSSLDSALYGVKFLAGLIVIGLMEMVLIRSEKGKNVSVLWIVFFVVLVVTLYLGFFLPMGASFLR